MALTLLDDLDRLANGQAAGNVITGVGSLSGNAGKDVGANPALVTMVNATAVAKDGTTDIAGNWGTLHIKSDGSYTYTRTTKIYDMGAPDVGAAEVFTYRIKDAFNATDTATLTINLLAETATTQDKNGVHHGSAFDDYIDGEKHERWWGSVRIDGGDGDDKIVGQKFEHNMLIGGAGDDWLVANSYALLDGGAGADKLQGDPNQSVMATYAGSKAGVTVDLTAGIGKGGDAEGDTLVAVRSLLGSKFADTLTGSSDANFLQGGAGNDTLNGLDGKDELSGGVGNDTLNGGNQDDTLIGGEGADALNGGDGTDTVNYYDDGKGITIDLTDTSKNTGIAKGDSYSSIEVYLGGNGADKMIGDDAGNTFDGSYGSDTLLGGKGKDTLLGGDGDDVLVGGAGADTLDGGNDSYSRDSANYADQTVGITIDVGNTANSTGDAKGDTYVNIDRIDGTQGDDFIFNGTSGDIELHGGKGNDFIQAGSQSNFLYGDEGDDTLIGGGSFSSLAGGAGNDSFIGNGNQDAASYTSAKAAITLDLLNAGASTGDAKGDTFLGIEEFYGSDFNDKLYGSDNSDNFNGASGADTIYGRGGDDTLSGDFGNDTINGGEGNDTLDGYSGDDKVNGDAGEDKLNGRWGNDTLAGGEGNDTLHGDGDNDKLDGGLGNDFLFGDDGKDSLTGGYGSDYLEGGKHNDTLNGGEGNDVLDGGDGADTLTGGKGNDTFAFGIDDDGTDKVTDFKFGEDRVVFLDVPNGAGNDLQDLLDAGIQIQSKGSTLTITEGDRVVATLAGWTGPQITSVQDWLQVMALSSFDDLDRSKNGVATGNVVTGADTLTGIAGQDAFGIGPDKVIQVGATAVPAMGGADIAGNWGNLHINQDGSYSYTRSKNIYDMNGPGEGATEVFTYTVQDKNGATETATLTIDLLPQSAAALDKNGVHVGSSYDDFIDAAIFQGVVFTNAKIDGGDGSDKIVGAGSNTYSYLYGGAGNDWLISTQADLLDGGAGADRLEGTNGSFATVSYAGSKAGVTVNLSNGTATGGDAEGDILVLIDRMVGSKLSDTLTGNNNHNNFEGGEGNDTLNGLGGYDTLSGGAGNDTLNGGADGDMLYGGAGNDTLNGGNEDDTLNGGAGADKLNGGIGFDSAQFGSAPGVGITLNLADASKNTGDAKGDTFDSIEMFIGTGSNDVITGDDGDNIFDGAYGDDRLTGGKGKDKLLGSEQDDILIGGAGADILDGGADQDTASYADLLTGITIYAGDSTMSTGDAKGDVYMSIEAIEGTQGDDEIFDSALAEYALHGGKGNDTIHGTDQSFLFGDAGDDTLVGGGAYSYLQGGAGADWLVGAGANDIASYSEASAAIVIDLMNGAANKGDAKGDTFLGIEEFHLSSYSDKFYGSADADRVVDYSWGDDLIDGRGGNDVLDGGFGNDTLIGGEGDDTLKGGYGNDKLTGGLDNDTLKGGENNDALDGGDGKDSLFGETGNDTLNGGLDNDYLEGGLGNDTLNGGDGDDTLYGGQGTDKLTGGKGSDLFAFGINDDAKDTASDFKFGEDRLAIGDILDGVGNDLQDLIDAGVQAASQGSTLTLSAGGEVMATISGWSGPQITSVQDLAASLGSDLMVAHA